MQDARRGSTRPRMPGVENITLTEAYYKNVTRAHEVQLHLRNWPLSERLAAHRVA